VIGPDPAGEQAPIAIAATVTMITDRRGVSVFKRSSCRAVMTDP
jgi:hypothetical protein